MAKKQVRLDKDKLSGQIGKSQFINFVMKNGSVFLAKPTILLPNEVKIKNTKGHTLLLPLAQIEEIWADEKAE